MIQYIWQRPDWTSFRWNNGELAQALGSARFHQGRLLGKTGSLGMALTREAQAEILVEETVKTSLIEGNTLNRESVRSSVAMRLGLPSAGLPSADRYTDGLVEALLDATQNFSASLTPERLCAWQAALFPTGYSGMSRIRTGEWRGDDPMRVVSGPVGKETVHFEAPPSGRIAGEMERFILWWRENSGELDGVVRAGIAHFYSFSEK